MPEPRDPFNISVDGMLDVLTSRWEQEYPEIGFYDGQWYARHQDASDDDVIRASTAGELDQMLARDWAGRHP